MRLVLSHHTALEFWLSSLSLYKSEFGEITAEISRMARLGSFLRAHDGTPIEIEHLVPAKSDRFSLPSAMCHVWGDNRCFPLEHVLSIGSDLNVTSPELTYLLTAEDFTIPELVRMGTELCSVYAYPYNQWGGDPIEREPVATRESILAFLDRWGEGVRGIGKARRAAKHIIDNTRSPREATLASLLALPSALGGQHVPGFVANPQVLLDKHGSKLTSRKYLEVDLYWPKQKVGIEYNSHLHDPNEAAYRDLEKITTLQTMGITVVPLNTQHMNDYESFSIILASLRRRLGIRDRAPQEAQPARRDTHFQLLKYERTWSNHPSLTRLNWWQVLLPMIRIAA